MSDPVPVRVFRLDDLEPADPVAHRDERCGALTRVRGDPPQRLLGVGVGGVFERDDGPRRIGVMVAHAAHERGHGAGGRVVYGIQVLLQHERSVGDAREPHLRRHQWSPPSS